MIVTQEFWWEHVGNSDQLTFVRHAVEPVGDIPDCCQVQCRPTLLIGDSIHMQEADIDISRVIMVDVLSSHSSHSHSHSHAACNRSALQETMTRFAILIEGTLLPGTGVSCWGFRTNTAGAGVNAMYPDGETREKEIKNMSNSLKLDIF